jgi:hypothetical protein
MLASVSRRLQAALTALEHWAIVGDDQPGRPKHPCVPTTANTRGFRLADRFGSLLMRAPRGNSAAADLSAKNGPLVGPP